jgi:hypothetical protein
VVTRNIIVASAEKNACRCRIAGEDYRKNGYCFHEGIVVSDFDVA